MAGQCREADILVVAAGRPKMITSDMVKPGAVVIDVGTNLVDKGFVGDVDYDAVSKIAGVDFTCSWWSRPDDRSHVAGKHS